MVHWLMQAANSAETFTELLHQLAHDEATLKWGEHERQYVGLSKLPKDLEFNCLISLVCIESSTRVFTWGFSLPQLSYRARPKPA